MLLSAGLEISNNLRDVHTRLLFHKQVDNLFASWYTSLLGPLENVSSDWRDIFPCSWESPASSAIWANGETGRVVCTVRRSPANDHSEPTHYEFALLTSTQSISIDLFIPWLCPFQGFIFKETEEWLKSQLVALSRATHLMDHGATMKHSSVQ